MKADSNIIGIPFNPWRCANGVRVRGADAYWRLPLKWNRAAELAGDRRRVFCASLADVFEDWNGPIYNPSGTVLFRKSVNGGAPDPGKYTTDSSLGPCWAVTMDDLRRDLFALIDKTPWLDWLLLTKRPGNIGRMWLPCSYHINDEWGSNPVPRRANCWLGTSVSNQQTADELVPQLLACRDLAPVLFLSAEPLLGPIGLNNLHTRPDCIGWLDCLTGAHHVADYGRLRVAPGPSIDLIITGDESGPKRRHTYQACHRSIVRQCQAAGVSVFVKQLEIDGQVTGDVTKFPADLRLREMPC